MKVGKQVSSESVFQLVALVGSGLVKDNRHASRTLRLTRRSFSSSLVPGDGVSLVGDCASCDNTQSRRLVLSGVMFRSGAVMSVSVADVAINGYLMLQCGKMEVEIASNVPLQVRRLAPSQSGDCPPSLHCSLVVVTVIVPLYTVTQ